MPVPGLLSSPPAPVPPADGCGMHEQQHQQQQAPFTGRQSVSGGAACLVASPAALALPELLCQPAETPPPLHSPPACFLPAAAAWPRRRPPRQRTTIPSSSSGACRQLRGRQRQPRRRTCGRLLTAISGTTQSGARWTSQTGTPRASCAAPSWPPASGEWREAAAVAAGGAGVVDNKGEQRGPLRCLAGCLPTFCAAAAPSVPWHPPCPACATPGCRPLLLQGGGCGVRDQPREGAPAECLQAHRAARQRARGQRRGDGGGGGGPALPAGLEPRSSAAGAGRHPGGGDKGAWVAVLFFVVGVCAALYSAVPVRAEEARCVGG